MTYNVTIGSLPADGDLFDPREAIPDFVNGTYVAGLTADAFDTSELTFISSQTDPVAAPKRALFWFKRGEGQLYIWDSMQRYPTTAATGYSAIAIGVGPRAETIGYIGTLAKKGNVFYPTAYNYYKDTDALTRPYRITPRMGYSPGQTGVSNSHGYSTMFVSSDTGESNAYGGQTPMVIRGFVDAMAHSGVTCTPAQRAVVAQRGDMPGGQDAVWIRSSDHHSADSLARLLGYIVGSLAQPEAGLVKIYKVGCPDTYRW